MRPFFVAGSVVVGSVVVVLGRPAALAGQDLPTGARRWVATEGVATPWVFDLVMKDGAVNGQAMQRAVATGQRPNPPLGSPFQISNGTVVGDTIKFSIKVDGRYGGADRLVIFRGIRRGDTIDFNRSIVVTGGAAPGNGIVGENGARKFSAGLLVAGAAVPLGIVRGRFPGDGPDSAHRETVVYRGYTLDVTAVNTNPNRDSLVNAVHGQLDLVENVALPPDLHSFVKSVPMVMYDGEGTLVYAAGKIRIPSRSAFPYDTRNPILLHELCHAIEDKKLPDGFSNSEILTLYDAAKRGGRFPADAYLLSRPGEYFAVMASTYLHGTADQEPFARDSIRIKQPAMYDWLMKQFGPRPE